MNRSRADLWKEKQLILQAESKSIEDYVTKLEINNYTLAKQLDEALLKLKEAEVDNSILKIKLEMAKSNG